MGRRRKAPSNDGDEGRADCPVQKKPKVAANQRNRASASGITKLYPSLSDDQKAVIKTDLKQGSLLDIKCDQLNNPLCGWLTKLYCPKERAFVIPGRGSIPVNEQTVYETMGLPRGAIVVPYHVDYDIEEGFVQDLFPEDGSRPKLTRVGEILSKYEHADVKFKKLWMVYVTCGLLAPTTDTHISNKCYPMLVNIEEAGEYNLCKFLVDYLHDNLSNGKFNNACLLYGMLRYASSLNCDDYVIDLGEGEFGINIWTKTAIDAIAVLDGQDNDPYSFGKLQLKEEFAVKLEIFGGPAGFDNFMADNIHPSCTEEEKRKIASLIFDHAVGFSNLLSKLVQGWSSLGPGASTSMANAFKSVHQQGRGCTQQGIDEAHVDEPGSDSESSTEKDISLSIRPTDVARRVSRNTGISRQTSIGTTAPIGKTSEQTHDAASIGGSTEILEEAGASDGKNGGSGDEALQGTEKIDDEDRGTSSMMMDNNAGQDEESRGAPEKSIAEKQVFSFSQVIPIPDSDASVSETATGGYDSLVIESQTSSQNVDTIIRSEAAAMATRLSGSRRRRSPAAISKHLEKSHEEVKRIVAGELGLLKGICTAQGSKDVSQSFSTAPTGISKSVGESSGSVRARRLKLTTAKRSPRLHGPPSSKTANTVVPLSTDGSVADLGKGQLDTPSTDENIVDGKPRVINGTSYRTTIVLSPTPAMGTSTPVAPIHEAKQGGACEHGDSASRAIVISPTVRAESNLGSTAIREKVLASLLHTPSPHGLLPRANFPSNADRSPVAISSELQRLVAELSAAVNDKERQKKGKAVAVHSASGSRKNKPRDMHAGMFTPSPFHLLSQSSPSSSEYDDMNVDSSPERDGFVGGISAPIDAPPIAWARNEDIVDKEKKLVAYMDGTFSDVDSELCEMLDQIEEDAREGHKRLKQSGIVHEQHLADDGGLLSATPNPIARKTRILKPSRFKSSPFDDTFRVTEDQEDVYKKLMLSTKGSRSSNIKELDIIKYHENWVHTVELADAMKPRAQLSTRVCDLAIEYIREHCRVDKRMVFPYLVVHHLLANEFNKKVVLRASKRQKNYSLTTQNQILFAVMENFGEKHDDPHHFYVVGINMVAKRFEVLDSLRGPNSDSLIAHSNRVISKLKEAWDVFYETAKNKIHSFETRIIEVPAQPSLDECGFFMLNNLERWFGQEIPEMQPHDIVNAKKIWPYRLLSSHMNKTTKWRYHLDNNKL